MLSDYVIQNAIKFIEHLHPLPQQLSNADGNTHYMVHSRDAYMNAICTNVIIESCYNQDSNGDIKKYKPIFKESLDIPFKSMDNIVDIDCSSIQRKNRNVIHEFISKFAKRQAIGHHKHIIIIRNFEHIMIKFQQIYKSLMDKYITNSCFIITTTQYNLIHEYVKNVTSFIRVPLLDRKRTIEFLEYLCIDKEIDGLNISQIVDQCSEDLYTCVCELEYLNNTSQTESNYVNLFEKNIDNLIELLKKTKSFDKAIDYTRNHMNKLLHYSLQDNYVFGIIYNRVQKYPKLKKNIKRIVLVLSDQNEKALFCSKKIFLYERIFIEIYRVFHNLD